MARLVGMQRFGRAATVPSFLAVVILTSLGFAVPAHAEAPVPSGYKLTARTELSAGAEHLQLVQANPPLVVNVARIAPGAPVSLRAVLSNEEVAGPDPRLERTSSMCARVRCLVGLNGDFADVGSQEPLGGLVTGGQLLRSPNDSHHQLSITKDGRLQAGSFEWSGTLVPTDLRSMDVDGVNVTRGENRVVLYTPAFGPSTGTGPVTSLVIRTVEPAGPLRLGQTSLVELVSLHEDQPSLVIPPDGGVLAGEGDGAKALRDLWNRVQTGAASARALLRLETPAGVVESLGGSPILIRDGKRWFADVDDNFTRGRHPRTLVGWNQNGEVLLVTVDGRQPRESVGMTLAEASDLMLELGATEAINLDGGGSTTFVVKEKVVNQPSDVAVRRGGKETIHHVAQSGDKVIGHVERPVASGLMLVPSNAVAVPPANPLSALSLDLPQALVLTAGSSTDPGSVPDGGLPALLTEEVSQLSSTVRVTAVAANVAAALALAVVLIKRRWRARLDIPAVF